VNDMTAIQEGCLEFVFPDDMHAVQYDKTSLFIDHIEKIQKTKAVDIVFLDTDDSIVLMEIKDFVCYAPENRTKIESGVLFKDLLHKVKDTLFGLWIARFRENEQFAPIVQNAFTSHKRKVKVFFFMEEDAEVSRLFSKKGREVNMKMKLNQIFSPLMIKPLLLNACSLPQNFTWKVKRVARPVGSA